MRTLLVALFLAAVSISPAPAATAPDAEPVLSATAAALGADHLRRLPSFHAIGKAKGFGLSGSMESWTDVSAGGVYAGKVDLGVFRQGQGFDGRDSWTMDDKGVVWVDGSEQSHASAINEAFRESYALWTPKHGGASVTLAAPQTDGGVKYNVITVNVPGSVVPFDVWIDPTTHLPARYMERSAAVTTTTTLGDYRPVAGVYIAFSQSTHSDQGNDIAVTFDRVEVAPADIAARVRKPVSNPTDFTIAGGTSTTIPFTLIDNHVYLDVMLNGKGPFRFIFDTGGQNVIDPAVAREIGSAGSGSVQGGGVGATTEEVQFARVASLRVGRAELRDQGFAVLPVRAGFGVAGSAPVDGLIGAEVLARFITVFDYADNKVVLAMAPTTVLGAGAAIPFTFTGTQPLIPCTIDAVPTQCSIDTGSRSSIDLHAPFVAAHPAVVPGNATAPGINGFGVGGADVGRLARLQSVGIGPYNLPDIITGLSSAQTGAFAVPGIGANIGAGILKRFNVTFDYQKLTMYLEPNASFKSRDEYERSGLFVVNKDGLVVAAVRPGTPGAAAGITRGDHIRSLDGTPVAKLTLGDVRAAFRKPAGTRVLLEVQGKDGASRSVTLTLQDYV
jgi:hypothetical protein